MSIISGSPDESGIEPVVTDITGTKKRVASKRFLFVNQWCPPDAAATAQLLGDLVETAAAAGHSCRVVASNRGYLDPACRYPRREWWNGAQIERVPSTGFGRNSFLGRAADYVTFAVGALARMFFGPRPDVVIGLSTPPILGALAVIVSRWRGARSVYWTMDVYPDIAFALGTIKARSIAGRFLSAVSRWTVRSADLVVALGDTMAGVVERQGARRVASVHNWADENAVRPMRVERSVYRATRGWGSRIVVLYSGNMGLAHEFETVLAAAERLKTREDIVFAFVGDGPRRKEIQFEVGTRGLKNVEFHGGVPRADLGDSLAAGDVHLVTLRSGMPGLLVPSKIYGILAAGRPTLYVGPREGEVFEVVRTGCGAAVVNGDVDGVVLEVLAYAGDSDRRARQGASARALFEKRFMKSLQTAYFLHLLEELGDAS